MAYMRHLMLAVLLAACGDTPGPTANLCPAEPDRTVECEARCKTGDDTAEVCAEDAEVACLGECLRCNPQVAWCPVE